MSIVQDIIKKSLKKADVAVCVCTHRKINLDVMGDAMTLFANKHHRYTWMPNIGEADISRARSRAATYFLKQCEEDVLMWIDDDVRFTGEDVKKVVDHVLDGKLICGGMYVQKGKLDKTLVLEKGESITFSKDAKPQKVVAIAGGFTAVHRSVYESLSKSLPLCNEGAYELYPFHDSQPMQMEDGKWIFVPEDWALCLLARKQGIDTWIDPSIYQLGHLGEYQYDLRDRLRVPKTSWEGFEGVTFK